VETVHRLVEDEFFDLEDFTSRGDFLAKVHTYQLYFNRTLFSHGNVTEANPLTQAGYMSSASLDYVRPENLRAASRPREDFRNMTMADVERQAEHLPWGTADEVIQRLIAEADHAGANAINVSLNRGAMPHEMFMEQIRRFAREVLPALQAHQVTRVPAAETELATR